MRTNQNDVVAILGDDYDGSTNLLPFITTSSLIVDRVIQCASKKGVKLTAQEEEVLEQWLSAHFYVQSDKTYSSKSTADASASFAGQTTMGFDSSLYGQTALRVDPSGCLENIDKKQKVRLFWAGKK